MTKENSIMMLDDYIEEGEKINYKHSKIEKMLAGAAIGATIVFAGLGVDNFINANNSAKELKKNLESYSEYNFANRRFEEYLQQKNNYEKMINVNENLNIDNTYYKEKILNVEKKLLESDSTMKSLEKYTQNYTNEQKNSHHYLSNLIKSFGGIVLAGLAYIGVGSINESIRMRKIENLSKRYKPNWGKNERK